MRMLRTATLGLIGAVLVTTGSCYPGEVTSTGQLNLVATVRKPSFDFSTVQTFAMPDTIVQIAEDDPDAITISRANDAQILGQVRTHLLDLGWQEVTGTDLQGGTIPDVVVVNLVSATENTSWWVSYPGGCYWYYWCYGWYYPPVVGSTTYNAGTYFLVMANSSTLGTIGTEDSVEAVWTGVLDGVLSSSTSTNFTRLTDGIDQMFTQSAYLSGN